MKRDFKSETKEILLANIIEKNGTGPLVSWYGEGWHECGQWAERLGITSCIQFVNSYNSRIIEKEQDAAGAAIKIFGDATALADQYSFKLAAIKSSLTAYEEAIFLLAQTVNPQKSCFNTSFIQNSLMKKIDNCSGRMEIASDIAAGRLNLTVADGPTIMSIFQEVIDALPKLKTNERYEMSISPGVVIYYASSHEYDCADFQVGTDKENADESGSFQSSSIGKKIIDTEIDINSSSEEHLLKLKDFAARIKIGGDTKIEGMLGSNGNLELGINDTNTGTSCFYDTDGSLTYKMKWANDDDTYTLKIKTNQESQTWEISIKTGGEISALGIKVAGTSSDAAACSSIDTTAAAEYIDHDAFAEDILSDEEVIRILGEDNAPSPEKTVEALTWLFKAISLCFAPVSWEGALGITDIWLGLAGAS